MTKLILMAGLLVSAAVGSNGYAAVSSVHQTDVSEVSATRMVYLEKIYILERQLSDIDLKWNLVKSIPSEDSIAQAEGWYTFMEQRRKDLNTEVVRVKLEQLINYYNDILKFPVTEEVRGTIVQGMLENRRQNAADYPEHLTYIPEKEQEVTSLETWIVNQPAQYLALTNYLEQLVTQNL